MPKNYITLDIPEGVSSNGTEYTNKGRWYKASRVRWHNNTLRPIGGWSRMDVTQGALDQLITDSVNEVCRALISWKTNDGSSYYAAGTNLGLYAFRRSTQDIYDITPVDFTPRPVEATSNDGYGMCLYGTGPYNTSRPYDPDNVNAFSWCLRNWGENLLAAPRGAPSKLYEWGLNIASPAVAIPNAPTDFDCFHVTDQRIVMVAGGQTTPRTVFWSASENNNEWAPDVTNQAGSMHLPGVGRFKEIVTVQDQYLLVSETDAYIARYLGPPYIYGFDQVATDCGALSGASVVSTGEFAMWPGYSYFFMFDGATVRRIECEVMAEFINTQNIGQTSKIVGFVNPDWPEIWWLFQSGSDDVDSYVFYNWVKGTWGIGKLNRSAAAGHLVTGGLLMVSNQDGYVYSHEQRGVVPTDTDGSDVFVESGPIEVSQGNTTQFIKSIQPDFIQNGMVDVTLFGRDRPNGPETMFGPYEISYPPTTRQPVACRARGHTVRVRIEGKDGAWALGKMRLDLKLGGEK